MVPAMIGAQQLTHTVEKGDTLWSICEKYYGDPDLWPKLWQMNPFVTNPHFLKPGDVIVLLEKELLAADPAEIARVAMDSGNVQRGMKVFYESSAACFACHDPPKGAARLGPDLTSLKTTLSPEQLVNALLRPSELIDKAYAQVTVLDVDGQVRMGIRVEENETQIVLRNLAAPDPITITKDEIDEIQESAVSLMPENLMRQLKSRKEFDDLLRYVLEVRRQ